MNEMNRRSLLHAGIALTVAPGTATLAAAMREEIIDIHPHIIGSDLKRYPPSPVGSETSDWSQEHPQSFEQYVAEADAAGISKAAIVQASTFYGVNNSYLIDSIARNRKRFTGVCSIDTTAPNAVQTLEALLKRGVTGLRIRTGASMQNVLGDPKAAAVWRYAATKQLTVCVSTQAAGMVHVPALLQRFPDVKLVLDHASMIPVDDGPPFAKAATFFELARHRNFYIKVTPRTFALSRQGKSNPDAFFQKLVAVFGADRLAFGSNLPSDEGPLTKLVADAQLCLAALKPTDRAMILAGTARRLYPALA